MVHAIVIAQLYYFMLCYWGILVISYLFYFIPKQPNMIKIGNDSFNYNIHSITTSILFCSCVFDPNLPCLKSNIGCNQIGEITDQNR